MTMDLQDVFNVDGLANSHPIYVPVNHPDEINEIFDRISYAKVGQSQQPSPYFSTIIRGDLNVL